MVKWEQRALRIASHPCRLAPLVYSFRVTANKGSEPTQQEHPSKAGLNLWNLHQHPGCGISQSGILVHTTIKVTTLLVLGVVVSSETTPNDTLNPDSIKIANARCCSTRGR